MFDSRYARVVAFPVRVYVLDFTRFAPVVTFVCVLRLLLRVGYCRVYRLLFVDFAFRVDWLRCSWLPLPAFPVTGCVYAARFARSSCVAVITFWLVLRSHASSRITILPAPRSWFAFGWLLIPGYPVATFGWFDSDP